MSEEESWGAEDRVGVGQELMLGVSGRVCQFVDGQRSFEIVLLLVCLDLMAPYIQLIFRNLRMWQGLLIFFSLGHIVKR